MNNQEISEFCMNGIKILEKNETLVKLNEYFLVPEKSFTSETLITHKQEIQRLMDILKKYKWKEDTLFQELFDTDPLIKDLILYIKQHNEYLKKSFDLSEEKILSIALNDTKTCFTVATTKSGKIFRIDPFEKLFLKIEGMKIMKLLDNSSLIAFVGSGENIEFPPKRLQLYDTHEEKVLTDMTFPSTILNLFLTKNYLIVVLERKIVIFDLKTSKNLNTIYTDINPNGVADFVEPFLAYPSDTKTGNVGIYDLKDRKFTEYSPHENTLSVIKISKNATFIATASDGKNIPVYSIKGLTPHCIFKRGSNTSQIYSIDFNSQEDFCLVSSPSTIHIFKIELNSSWTNWTRHFYSFEFCKIPFEKSVYYYAAYTENKTIVVISTDGYLYRYTINDEKNIEKFCKKFN